MGARAISDAVSDHAIGALIVGGAHGSLGLARGLGRRGIPVCFVSDDHRIAKYSRYVGRAFDWPGPLDEGALAFLLGLASRHHLDSWVLIAAGDAELRLISQHHAELSSVYRVTVPPWEIGRWAHDKQLTYQRAAALGIDYPRSYDPRDLQDVAQLDCRFPVVLKPAVREQRNAFTQAKAWRCDDRASLLARYEQAAALVDSQGIVLQELIPGGGSAQFSYAGVWDRGSPVASLVARRTRQYPVEFGYTSTFVEAVEQSEVEDAACRFLRSLDYSGLVEVEFKYDRRDGRYKLLDVNARAWTWCALGSIAGVDFAHVLWRIAMGEAVEPIRGRANVAWMHGMRDLVAAGQEMLAGRLSPLSYMRGWHQPLVFAAFAKDDPLPGIVDLPILLWRLLAREAEIARGTSAFHRPPLQDRFGTRPARLDAFTGARRKG
jgi:predicted ATP-grasp superfamily ATP-dependent carboligase